MDFPERLRKLIKVTGLNVDTFSGEVSTSRAQIYNYLKGDNEPPGIFFQEVKKKFPWISLEWLVADIGKMVITEAKIQQTASGDGNIQTGGTGTVSIKRINESDPTWGDDNLVSIRQVKEVLEDYVAPKIIREIEERLKKEK